MAYANKVIFIGNLTRDPEIKYTPKGTPVASFGLAGNRHFTKENGEKGEDVTFLDVIAFGNNATILEKYATKGKSLYIEGRLKLDSWEDKESGEKRSKLRVVIETFQFLGKKSDSVDEPPSPAPAAPVEEDDIPF